MFDNVIEASKQRFSDDPPDEETVAALPALVPAAETLEHGLWSTGAIAWTRDGRDETLSPGPDEHAFVLVTERRVHCVAGEAPADPSPSLHLSEITTVEYRSSLLSSSFAVETGDERISITPGGGEPEAVAAYIEETAESWRQMDAAIENARDTLAAYRDEDGMFDDIWRVGKQIRSHLQTAARAADRDEEAVAAHFHRIFEPIAADLAQQLRAAAHDSVSDTDETDDGAKETYQQARDVMAFTLEIAEAHTTLDVAPFEESLETLEEDMSRSEWQWGGAG